MYSRQVKQVAIEDSMESLPTTSRVVGGGHEIGHTVDGRNPKQPPGMVLKPCIIMGYYDIQLVQDFLHQQYDTNPNFMHFYIYVSI